MKVFLFVLACVLLSATYFNKSYTEKNQITVESAKQKAFVYKQRYAFSCSPDLALIDLTDITNEIPLLQGWGNYSMPVTTANDSARIYFEQGINMYYAFHIIEALASFDKAVKFDNKFAMGYWGKALAYGPNINDVGYNASPESLAAAKTAKELSANCTTVEKGLINAMQVRYSPDTTQAREYLNELYADAMMKTYQQFPNNADVAALYADALMVQHPWDLYDKYGKPKKWTPQIVEILEGLLKLSPDHPGACHYYIHAVEGSNHPERGLEVAARLPGLMPGVAHVVHMPSHIYIRSGYYKEGFELNEKAVKSYYNYLGNYSPVVNNSLLYLVHNLHMQATCASMDGRFADAIKISTDCKKSIDSSFMDSGDYMAVYAQYLYMTPYFTLIRFGKWNEVLNTSPVPESRVYANLIWHYGRGLAYAREHSLENANAELELLRADMQNSQLLKHPAAFNPGIAGAEVAEKILEGVIAEERGDLDQSIILLKDAVEKEDNMLYNEPKDWVHPARQYLGNVLIKANRFTAAEKVFREDLEINPNNGWSLTGMVTALVMQGKKKEGNAIQQQLKTSFARADTKIIASVF